MEFADVEDRPHRHPVHPGADPREARRTGAAHRGRLRGRKLLLVGVLRGAVMVMADLARELKLPIEMDWMAVSSYGAGTQSSGVVRILKDLDSDLEGRHVLIVEDIIDSGLTLSWLRANLESRGAASVEICALLRKPEAAKVDVDVKLRRLRHPECVRRRLRPRLRRAVPQPARNRGARPARVQLSALSEQTDSTQRGPGTLAGRRERAFLTWTFSSAASGDPSRT